MPGMPFSWQRRRHRFAPHAFLVDVQCAGENYPDLLDELLAAGARKMTFADMVWL